MDEKISQLLVNKNNTIKGVMKVIDKGSIGTAFVIDENKYLTGTVTDGDLRRAIILGKGVDESIEDVMNKSPVAVKERDYFKKASKLMKEKKLNNIPVVDDYNHVIDVVHSVGGEIYSISERLPHKPIKKVLVIGGAGYIGSVLVSELLEKGYKVKVLDLFVYGKNSLNELKNNPNLEIFEGDTRHIEAVTEAVNGIDAVVHLAELVGDPVCSINPKITQDINHLATKLIASVCKYYQINRFVYASSCSVYGASKNNELLNEKSHLNPLSLYAKMKIGAEKALMDIADDNFSPTILRLGTVFGLSLRPRFDLVVNYLSAKALNEGRITIFGGDQWRPNVHVSDVAKAIICCLEAPIEKVSGQIFNVGSNNLNFTINQIGDMIHKFIPEVKIIKESIKDDNRDYKVDFTKIKSILNYKPDKDLEDGIKEIIEAFKGKKVRGSYLDDVYSNVKYLKNKEDIL